MCTIGQVVYSKAGRDKGLVFVVVCVEGEFVYLVDGKLRTLAKPKKKKQMHIQVTKEILTPLQTKLNERLSLSDADIRKALLPYNRSCEGK